MELRHLRYFAAVVDAGSIAGAARELGLAQPLVSKRVTELERELGVELFARHNRGVALTPAGHAFLDHARAALDSAAKAAAAARANGGSSSGRTTAPSPAGSRQPGA